MKPPIPSDEQARLRALRRYEILDTPSEQEYDDIALLAAQICGTPIATITLVDENRQWFKSKIGLEVSETSRDVAFCAYAVMPNSQQAMVVKDTLEDKRFAENPLGNGQSEHSILRRCAARYA
jgi:GAF domain-containing protein